MGIAQVARSIADPHEVRAKVVPLVVDLFGHCLLVCEQQAFVRGKEFDGFQGRGAMYSSGFHKVDRIANARNHVLVFLAVCVASNKAKVPMLRVM